MERKQGWVHPTNIKPSDEERTKNDIYMTELPDTAVTLFCQSVTLKVAGEGRIELISFNLSQFQGQEVDVIVIPKAG